MTTRRELEALLNSPNVQKYLNLISQTEGTTKNGYATAFGGSRLNSLSDHPRTLHSFTQTDGRVNKTSAAGRYQFLRRTWDDIKQDYGLKDFSPRSQDIGALALISRSGAMGNVLAGDFRGAIKKTGGIWASLPSSPYAQPKRSWQQVDKMLGNQGYSGGSGGSGSMAAQKGTTADLDALFNIPSGNKNQAPVNQKSTSIRGSIADLDALFGINTQTQPKQEAPNALVRFGHGMHEALGGIKQGYLYAKDAVTDGNDYDKYTAEQKEAEALYQKGRSDNGMTGIDGMSLLGGIVATLPAAGAIKGFQGAKVLSQIGAKVLAQNAAVGAGIGVVARADDAGERLANTGMGAVGGAAGAVVGKGLEKVGQAVAGKLAQKATQKALDAPKNALTQNARNIGYSVPPSYSNPNFFNKTLAKVAGEADLARIASAKNQHVTNSLARKAVGLADDQPLTTDALNAVRQEAGQAYNGISALGKISTDAKYSSTLDDIAAQYASVKRSFPNMKGGTDIDEIVAGGRVQSLLASDALEAIKHSREMANSAYKQGDSAAGKAYKRLAEALEDQLERSAMKSKQDPALIQNFVNARKIIAKTYSIENALDANGNVSARKLASTIGKKPLSAELKQAAEFSQVYPQLNNVGVHGGNGITLFDSVAGLGGGVATGNPGVAAIALARPALKAGLNTNAAGKALGTPSYDSSFLRLLKLMGRESPVLPVAGANTAQPDRKK